MCNRGLSNPRPDKKWSFPTFLCSTKKTPHLIIKVSENLCLTLYYQEPVLTGKKEEAVIIYFPILKIGFKIIARKLVAIVQEKVSNLVTLYSINVNSDQRITFLADF